MKELKQTIILNIKKYRQKTGKTQSQLAEACELTTSYIGELEIGRSVPSLATIDKIAHALNIKPFQLFLDEDDWPMLDRIELADQIHEEIKSKFLSLIDENTQKYRKKDESP